MKRSIIVVVILGSAFLVERRQRTAIVQEVEKRALVMAQSLESTVTNDLLTYNYVSIEQTTLQFSKKPDLVYAIVLDKEGNVAAQFIRDFPLSRILQTPRELKAGTTVVDQLQLPGTERETVYDVRLPVTVEGSSEVWGVVRLGVSLLGMYQEISRTRWQIAGFVVLGLLVGSASSLLLARRMARPIQALMQGVAAVGRGDFGHRIEVTSQDELGQLSAAFNDMSDRLASAPGITGVSYSDYVPLGFGTVPWSDIHVEGYLPGRSEDMRIAESAVASGFSAHQIGGPSQ